MRNQIYMERILINIIVFLLSLFQMKIMNQFDESIFEYMYIIQVLLLYKQDTFQDMLKIVVLFILSMLASSQKCLNHNGTEVNWFVILITPGSMDKAGLRAKSYHYYDSNSNSFQYFKQLPDSQNHPIYNTFKNLSNSNSTIYAWSDQAPTKQEIKKTKKTNSTKKGNKTKIATKTKGDQIPSSTKKQKISHLTFIEHAASASVAHAKTVVGYSDSAGIVIDHSIPYYPFIKNGTINQTIRDSQRRNGQHFFCFSSGNSTKDLLTKAKIIKPEYYCPAGYKRDPISPTLQFQYQNLTVGGNKMQIIFKNGYNLDKKNYTISIFENGLTAMLKSNLITQTWHAHHHSYCKNKLNSYRIESIQQIKFGNTSWLTKRDHSKWAIADDPNNNYACFGDMNREPAQLLRGGAFYCIEDKGLKTAMKAIAFKFYPCKENGNTTVQDDEQMTQQDEEDQEMEVDK